MKDENEKNEILEKLDEILAILKKEKPTAETEDEGPDNPPPPPPGGGG
jgi:hypothetical protein